MTLIRIVEAPGLLVEAQSALGKTQETLGTMLGVSRKTMGRWMAGRGSPTIGQWANLARAVHAVNPPLAQRIATEMGETLVSLGLVAPPPSPEALAAAAAAAAPPPLAAADLVDSIVCAAAEAVNLPPQAIRPALLAAYDRTASVRLSIEQVRDALRPPPPPPPLPTPEDVRASRTPRPRRP